MNTRTNIVLNDALVAQAMVLAKVTTKKAAVEAALRAYVKKPDYSGLLALRGQDVLDPDYDPNGLFGLTEAALERRFGKAFASTAAAALEQGVQALPSARAPADRPRSGKSAARTKPAPRKTLAA